MKRVILVGIILVIVIVLAYSCRPAAARSPIKCDGELDEPLWKSAIRTGPFLDAAGKPSAPYSDARFLVRPDALYLALYAADEHVTSDDHFRVEIGDRVFFFGPSQHGADVGVDMDGTLDDASDDDEEWVIEARVPYDRLPHGRTSVTIQRCEELPDANRTACGTARFRLDLP